MCDAIVSAAHVAEKMGVSHETSKMMTLEVVVQ
jgi:hypothetical protein